MIWVKTEDFLIFPPFQMSPPKAALIMITLKIPFTDVIFSFTFGGLYVNYYSGWLLSCRECWPDTQILNALINQDFQALLEPNPHLLPSPPLRIMGSFGPVSAIFFSTHFPVWNLNFTELKMPLGRKCHHLHRAGGRGRREETKLGVVSQMLQLSWGPVYSSSPGFDQWV